MKRNFGSFIVAFALCVCASSALAKTVRYELTIANQKTNITGKEVDFALAVNGSIPAPTLEFTEGDDAEIVVKNGVKDEEVSLHWHGILLPPEEDGVAYTNTPPIFPGKSRTFKFKIRQHGTYWYHSHTMVQEQKGVYGAIVIHPKKETIRFDKEAVVVLSDWSDENADQIIRNLRKDGDFYLYKKNSVRSIGGALRAGEAKTFFQNQWQRMGGMDLSDVGYDAFLINGKKDSQLLLAHPGERIRLRIVNASASTYFYVSLGQTPMQVISADGVDIEPAQAKELLMGMAETYDVLFTVPEHKNFELRATAQDVNGFASAWIGMGEKVSAQDKLAPDLYAPMNHSGHGAGAMDHSKMDHAGHSVESVPAAVAGPVLETLTVDDLKATASTVLPAGKKVSDFKLVLDGDMERYVWYINGKAIHEDRDILINEGDVVRFTFVNNSMMHHPMHLHGHFFRVLNKNGDRSPLKHTVDVPPMGTR
ncbi:MAG: multicopper oxidase domain-containing protein, partial [Bdellovibrionaceae bacterium]|nr:multicopper oxidase domain-containing protein [Pseudobdellovibrionaceae bacterium]